jgi:ABC-type phosphate/phosphonate transport system substrate-binding protein
MVSVATPSRKRRWAAVGAVGTLAAVLALASTTAGARQAKIDVLHIGSSGSLASEKDNKEKAALESLRDFIKEETGFTNDITKQKDWVELADKMTKGQLHIGVFQGYEFAWAKEKHPKLAALALAVNIQRYPVVYVVTKKDNKAKDFAGLAGQTLAIPATGQGYLRLYAERQAEKAGKKLETYFAKVTAPETVEDALEEVLGDKIQAAVVARSGLEAYKQRKPGRFKQLKPVAHSEPFPSTVVAYYGTVLDEATRQRFRRGLLDAHKKEKGQMMLTLFKLSGFEPVPADFEKVLTQTRKTYPHQP